MKGKYHIEMVKASTSSKSVASFFKPKTSQVVIQAEAFWASFVAEHNLAFKASDHATKLFSKMFPDSEVAKKFACGRTKTQAIIKEALAPHFAEKTLASMTNPFSILMDESNDKTDKSCIILVKVLDSDVGDIQTRFLDMPIVNIGTAVNLFDALKLSLSNKCFDFDKCIAFMSDTTNVMKGSRSGVQRLIKNECPNLYDVGCICHLADLTIKAGMKALPVDIDHLFIDIFYYFFHSSKRKQEFVDNWYSLFSSEPQTILKHCPTRWLSLLRCVGRYLQQFDGLKSYFHSCGEAETAKVISIIKRLEHPLTKPILLFLSYILPSMDRFNRVFQKSSENTTCELYSEMSRLVRLYASNILKADAIIAAGDNLNALNLDEGNQLSSENLGIGTDTWACVMELETEHDLEPFFKAARNFYIATINKMLKKFPFGDTLLKDLGIINPDRVCSYQFTTVLRLAERFPQLGLTDAESHDKLREEFIDFILSQADHPPKATYGSADNSEKPRSGSFWWEVGKLKTIDGELRFPSLYKLMAGLLSIPVSNADSERGFSILRKIHTDQRPSLNQSTIIALMTMKFNCDDCCYNSNFNEEMLSKCKKATSVVVKH